MLFSASGSYFNQSVATSSNGEATYNLADGTYRVTASYLGYEYSTDLFSIPLVSSQTLAIPHQAHTVSVFRTYQNDRVALANIVKRGRIYFSGVKTMLFSASGSYLNQSITTSSNGEATYNLADGTYRVTASYLGYEYRTDPFSIPLVSSQTLAIPHQAHTVSVFRTYQNDRVALANIEATLN